MKLKDIKNYIDIDIYNFLKTINDKNIFFDILNDKLQKLYDNITTKNYIISFDIEFLRYNYDKININYIFEIGGIIIHKYKNKWYLISFFHYNIKPHLINDDMFIQNSEYCTISNETYNKVKKLENKLLPHLIYKRIDLNEIIINDLMNNNLINLLLSKNKLINIINNNNYDKFIKELKKILFKINGNFLKKNHLNYEYYLYNEINNLIFNDKDINYRYIKNIKKNLLLLKKIINNGYSIVKGIEDFNVIKNHLNLFNIDFNINDNYYYDIAKYNNELYNICNSAELKKSFICLINKKIIDENDDIYIKLKNNIYMKAHNPLVDSLMTLIIFNNYN